jgi:1,4-alpha-glucan branching enzyme
VPRTKYAIGVPEPGYYREILNSDSSLFGGSNMGNAGGVQSKPVPSHSRPHSLRITVPPLAVIVFEPVVE